MRSALRPRPGYFDPALKAQLLPVGAGEHGVSGCEAEMFTTTLGSCVSVCLRDRDARVGGMNHIMLPADPRGNSAAPIDRSHLFGDHSMEVLLNDILRAGGLKKRMEAKIFGGANVMRSAEGSRIGDSNAAFVERFLRSEGIPLIARDVGGNSARRIIFSPFSGRVLVNVLEPVATDAMAEREIMHRNVISRPPAASNIELFR